MLRHDGLDWRDVTQNYVEDSRARRATVLAPMLIIADELAMRARTSNHQQSEQPHKFYIDHGFPCSRIIISIQNNRRL